MPGTSNLHDANGTCEMVIARSTLPANADADSLPPSTHAARLLLGASGSPPL